MAQKKKKKKAKARNTGTKVVFWIALILLLAPFLVLGWILVSAAMDTGSPILGSRYEGDLNPAITKAELDSIRNDVNGISGVEGCEVELATATLRVYADISDSADADAAFAMADRVYSSVTRVLDPSVYFTQHDGMKMYDMEIHVYNQMNDTESDGFVYVIDTKTSSMEAPSAQLVSQPQDAELAQQLRQNVEDRKNPKPEPTAESGDMELPNGDTEAPVEESTDTTN